MILEKTKNELTDCLIRREAELMRVREQRDQRDSELKERKLREATKSQALHEFKQLAETRMVCVL